MALPRDRLQTGAKARARLAHFATPDAEPAALCPHATPTHLTPEEAVEVTDATMPKAMLVHHFGLFDFTRLDPAEGAARLPPAVEMPLVQSGMKHPLRPGR